MADLTALFLDSLDPELVLEDHGYAVTRVEGQATADCPDRRCRGQVRRVGRSWVCTSACCHWRAGPLVDYLIQAEGQPPETLLPALANRYPAELRFVGGLPWSAVSRKIEQQFARRRALLRFVVEHRGLPRPLTGDMALALDKLMGRGVRVEYHTHTILLLPENQCRQLAGLVTQLTGEEVEYPWSGGAMVVPLWTDFSTLSHFEVLPLLGAPVSAKPIRFDVSPAQLSFSGLWELPGDLRNVWVVKNPLEAAAMNENARYFARQRHVIGALRRPDAAQPPGLALPLNRYLFAPGEDLRTAQAVQRVTAQFTVGWKVSPEKAYEWSEFLAERISAAFRNNFDLAQARQDFSCLGDADRQALTDYLQRTRQLGMLEMLQLATATAPRVFTVRGADVRDSDSGYAVVRDGKPERPVTNFTLHFTHTVFFPQSSNVLHQGKLRFQGEEFPFLFGQDALYSWQKLLAAARFAVSCCRSETAQQTPAIIDPSLVPYLLQHLNLQASAVPRLEGVRRLGWSSDRQRFDSPGWRLEHGEWAPRETRADPAALPLRQFDFSMRPPTPLPGHVLSDLAGELFALLTAQTGRVLRGVAAPPLVFRDTGQTASMLKRLFAGAFRQTSPLVLSWNRREQSPELEMLGGHPALATGELPENYLTRYPHPLFVISSAGRALEGDLEDADIATLTEQYPRVLSWLQTAPAAAMSFRQTPLYEHNLLLEGCTILKAALGYHWTGAPVEYPACQAVLDRYTSATLGDVMRENFSAQRMVINLCAVDEDVRPLFVAELTKVDPTFADGDFATMDLVQARSLLKSFFLEDLPLPVITSTQPTPEQWLVGASTAASA